MRVIAEAIQKVPDALGDQRVVIDVPQPLIKLRLRGQFAIQQQVSRLQE